MKAFKIYARYPGQPKNKYYYIDVRVHKTKARMVKELTTNHAKHFTNKTEAAVIGIEHYNTRGRKTGKYAMMFLNEESLKELPAEIIVHESAHAVFRLAHRLKILVQNWDMEGPVGFSEEWFCYVIGDMVTQINDSLHELKLI